jgi:hypothetical protein
VVRSELLRRSPLRILEKSPQGGPGKGGLGAVVARKGVGKTAFLVHLATFHLLEEGRVIHVSFSSRTDHIVDWYEGIFAELAKRTGLEGANAIHDECVRHRVIMNFSQTGVPVERIIASLRAMIGQAQFGADLVIVDGYSFASADPGSIEAFQAFARDMNLEIWFSVSLPTDDDVEDRIPDLLGPFVSRFATVIGMRAAEGRVTLRLLKDHDAAPVPDLRLRLDPKTLLVEE